VSKSSPFGIWPLVHPKKQREKIWLNAFFEKLNLGKIT
jgi:hypothetical protein